jgi:hypothetical protein
VCVCACVRACGCVRACVSYVCLCEGVYQKGEGGMHMYVFCTRQKAAASSGHPHIRGERGHLQACT